MSDDSSETKDELVAMLSHALRDPLSPIRTSVDVLQIAQPGSTEATQAIAIIDRAATHLAQLVDDLLDVTQVALGLVQLRRAPIELVALVSAAVEQRRARFTAHELAIELRRDERELWVAGDEGRLVQVIGSLLDNALRFTPAGGTVQVSVGFSDSNARIQVADTGIAIGLALVKALVQLHGGRVELAGAGAGRGTAVTIWLAAQRERDARRVLIVDSTSDRLRDDLVRKGHEVRVAHSSAAAVELMVAFRPDIVLCDIGTPELDAYALAMRARTDAALRSAYLVAVSEGAPREAVVRATAAGFHRHLAKPLDLAFLDQLLAALAHLPRWPDGHEDSTLH